MTALEQAAANFCSALVDAHQQLVTKDASLAERIGGLGDGVKLALGSLERAVTAERQLGSDDRKALYRTTDRTERKVDALLRAAGLKPEDFADE